MWRPTRPRPVEASLGVLAFLLLVLAPGFAGASAPQSPTTASQHVLLAAPNLQQTQTVTATPTVGTQPTATPTATVGASPSATRTPLPPFATLLNPSSALPLELVQLSLVGAQPNERIEILGFGRLLGTIFADAQGRAQFSFQVPVDAPPGQQPIDARGELSSGRTLLTVRGPDPTSAATATTAPTPMPTPTPSATPAATPTSDLPPPPPAPVVIGLFHDLLGPLEPFECPADGFCSLSATIPSPSCGADIDCEMVAITLCGQGACSSQVLIEPCGGMAGSCTSEPFDLMCQGGTCNGRLPTPAESPSAFSFFDVFLDLPELHLGQPTIVDGPDGPIVLAPRAEDPASATAPVTDVAVVCECEDVQIVSQGRQMLLYDSARRRVTLNFRVGWAITCSEGQIVDCHGEIGVDWDTEFPAAEVPAVFTIQCEGQICNGSTVGQQNLELILSDESVGFSNGWPSAPNWANKKVTYTFTRWCLTSAGRVELGKTVLTINFDRMGHPRQIERS